MSLSISGNPNPHSRSNPFWRMPVPDSRSEPNSAEVATQVVEDMEALAIPADPRITYGRRGERVSRPSSRTGQLINLKA